MVVLQDRHNIVAVTTLIPCLAFAVFGRFAAAQCRQNPPPKSKWRPELRTALRDISPLLRRRVYQGGFRWGDGSGNDTCRFYMNTGYASLHQLPVASYPNHAVVREGRHDGRFRRRGWKTVVGQAGRGTSHSSWIYRRLVLFFCNTHSGPSLAYIHTVVCRKRANGNIRDIGEEQRAEMPAIVVVEQRTCDQRRQSSAWNEVVRVDLRCDVVRMTSLRCSNSMIATFSTNRSHVG